ncbi:MAG: hypothetical protein HQL58_08650 [Magnetococcales bacterium]|nr:hypothetical protein [Magnetococcales bacterium]
MIGLAHPHPARWLRLLAVSSDLPAALTALASHSPVEPEWSREGAENLQPVLTPELSQQIKRFENLANNFQVWWPPPVDGQHPATHSANLDDPVMDPVAVLARALAVLEAWRLDAVPLIQRYQQTRAREADLALLIDLATALVDSPLKLGHLVLDETATFCLTSAIFVLPTDASTLLTDDELLLTWTAVGTDHRFLVAVAPRAEMDRLTEAVIAASGRRLILPDGLEGTGRQMLPDLERQRAACRQEVAHLKEALGLLGQRHRVAWHVRQVARLQWFFKAITTVSAGEVLSRLEGWVGPGEQSAHINHLLERAGVRALATVSDHGPGTPPMVLVNPWWARSFELFPRLLGTLGRDEIDPSRLLAIIAPLLFGFMFGDVGQGGVLIMAGWLLRRHLPASAAWLLISGGLSAMVFGLLFGSFFCLEHLWPALWLHPTQHPLPVLAVPMVLGVGLILTGLLFKAIGADRQGSLIPIYLGLLLTFLTPYGWWLVAIGAAWWLVDHWSHGLRSLPAHLAHLIETLMQLAVNTLSFARVGAFALAHAGLSQAVVTLAELSGGGAAGWVILLLGNALILMLEGLVVSVQTTRLILFEFFVRFLRGDGRPFRPLAPPPE